jgi:hypothetical protein
MPTDRLKLRLPEYKPSQLITLPNPLNGAVQPSRWRELCYPLRADAHV